MKKSYIIVAGLLAFLLVIGSIILLPAIAQNASTKPEVARHIIIMIDFTQSFQINNTENCWKPIELITGCLPDADPKKRNFCNKIRPKDRITIFKISEGTMRNLNIVADLYIKEKGKWDSEMVYNMEIAPIKTKFLDDIKKSLTKPQLSKNTEILAGIRVAQDQFDEVKASDKRLVILSDMIEDSEFYNFERNRVDPEQILGKESKTRRLPDLKGVKIYVSGATAMNQRKYDEIQNFWAAYFRRVGADYDRTRYSRQMTNF
jgi:hypothetical protein